MTHAPTRNRDRSVQCAPWPHTLFVPAPKSAQVFATYQGNGPSGCQFVRLFASWAAKRCFNTSRAFRWPTSARRSFQALVSAIPAMKSSARTFNSASENGALRSLRGLSAALCIQLLLFFHVLLQCPPAVRTTAQRFDCIWSIRKSKSEPRRNTSLSGPDWRRPVYRRLLSGRRRLLGCHTPTGIVPIGPDFDLAARSWFNDCLERRKSFPEKSKTGFSS